MIINPSNKETTVKKSVAVMKDDIWNVDRLLMLADYDGEAIIPVYNVLDLYREFFDTLLVDIDVPAEYFYDPRRFSKMYYGSPDLDFLILYFSNTSNSFDFNKESIKVLPKNELTKLNELMLSNKNAFNNNRLNIKVHKKLVDVGIKK